MSVLDRLDALLNGLTPKQTADLDKLLAEELKKPWLPTPGPQLEAYLSPADLLLFGGSAGGGKRLDHDTLVPVPIFTDATGFKRHGDLAVGDYVFSETGDAIPVVGVTDEIVAADCFEVELDTGEIIVADAGHRWHTWDETDRLRLHRSSEEVRARRRASRPSRAVAVSKKPWVSAFVSQANKDREYQIDEPSGAIRTTREILDTLLSARGALNHSIATASSLAGAGGPLPIEPYLFGLWIGDGYSRVPAIGMDSVDWPEIEKHTPICDSVYIDTRAPRKTPFWTRRFSFMLPHLRSMGVWGAKRIPATYLRASLHDRISLLQGILDTDGSCDQRGQIECGFSDELLAHDLQHLVSTLGIKSTLRRKSTSCQAGAGKDHYRIKFLAPFPAFRLPRKASRQKLSGFRPTVLRRFITAIRPAAPRLMKCIKVGSDKGLYCVTTSFIVTHNTDLICGLALTEHKRSVVFRSQSKDLDGFWERLCEISPDNKSQNSVMKKLVTKDDRLIEGGHLEKPGSEKTWQGRPHDLIGFDEGAQLSAHKVKFVMGWNRAADGRHCRAVIASNPPIGGEGAWLIEWFAPWLDPMFPCPAKHGELRWAVAVGDKNEITTVWTNGPEPIFIEPDKSWRLATEEEINQRPRLDQINDPISRTFIPSRLDDNPYLKDTNYRAQLMSMPEPLRSQLLHGDFLAGREDDEWQVIPSDWVRMAQARWTPVTPQEHMLAMGIDVAQGGADQTVLAKLHETNKFDVLETHAGKTTPDGPSVANLILKSRRDGAALAFDATGGWGGSAKDHLKTHHQVEMVPIVFSGGGNGIDPNTRLGFANQRAEMYWRFRLALDPDNGDMIALPPGERILAQLTAARWAPKAGKILIESKEDIRDRLGSSPDEADAVVMAWHVRNRAYKPKKTVTPRERMPTRTGWMRRG